MSFLRRGKTTMPAQPAGGTFVPMPVVLSDKGAYGEEGPSSLDATARRAPRPGDVYAPAPVDRRAAAAAAAAAQAAATPTAPPPTAHSRPRSVGPPS